MKKTPRWMKSAIKAAQADVPALPKGLGRPISASLSTSASNQELPGTK